MNSYNQNNQNNRNNQRTYNNNLLNQFNSHLNQPRQNSFMNNPMVNPMVNPNVSSMNNTNFYNKIQMAKIEQIKRAKNISDLGMDTKQLSEYIIDPIKINKTSQEEIRNKLHDIESNYIVPVTKNTKFEDQSNAYLRELWKNRTNQPYKNVIKKELFDKEYKKYYKDEIFKKDISSRNELIVHKVIKNIDADEDLLEAEFLLIQEILEKHNGELKNIYSSSNENKYKKEFFSRCLDDSKNQKCDE
jgi:ribosomal protein L7/L12